MSDENENKKRKVSDVAVKEMNPIVMLAEAMDKLQAAKARQNAGMAAERRAVPATGYFEPMVVAKRGRVGVQEVNICFVIAPVLEQLQELEDKEAEKRDEERDKEARDKLAAAQVVYHDPAGLAKWQHLHHCTECDMSWPLDEELETFGKCPKCPGLVSVIDKYDDITCENCGSICKPKKAAGRCHGCRELVAKLNLNPDKGPTSYCEDCSDICEQKPKLRIEDDGKVHQYYYCVNCNHKAEQIIDPKEMET